MTAGTQHCEFAGPQALPASRAAPLTTSLAQPHIERALAAMADMRPIEPEHAAAEFRQSEP